MAPDSTAPAGTPEGAARFNSPIYAPNTFKPMGMAPAYTPPDPNAPKPDPKAAAAAPDPKAAAPAGTPAKPNPNLRQGEMSPSERRREAEIRRLQATQEETNRRLAELAQGVKPQPQAGQPQGGASPQTREQIVEAWSADPDGRARSMARAELEATVPQMVQEVVNRALAGYDVQQSSNARAAQVQQELGVDKVPGGQYLLDGIAYSVFHDPNMKHFTQEEALGEIARRFREVTGNHPGTPAPAGSAAPAGTPAPVVEKPAAPSGAVLNPGQAPSQPPASLAVNPLSFDQTTEQGRQAFANWKRQHGMPA